MADEYQPFQHERYVGRPALYRAIARKEDSVDALCELYENRGSPATIQKELANLSAARKLVRALQRLNLEWRAKNQNEAGQPDADAAMDDEEDENSDAREDSDEEMQDVDLPDDDDQPDEGYDDNGNDYDAGDEDDDDYDDAGPSSAFRSRTCRSASRLSGRLSSSGLLSASGFASAVPVAAAGSVISAGAGGSVVPAAGPALVPAQAAVAPPAFPCRFRKCNKGGDTRARWTKHETSHVLTCFTCSQHFGTKDALLEHLVVDAGPTYAAGTRTTCPDPNCTRTFPAVGAPDRRGDDYSLHLREHNYKEGVRLGTVSY